MFHQAVLGFRISFDECFCCVSFKISGRGGNSTLPVTVFFGGGLGDGRSVLGGGAGAVLETNPP